MCLLNRKTASIIDHSGINSSEAATSYLVLSCFILRELGCYTETIYTYLAGFIIRNAMSNRPYEIGAFDERGNNHREWLHTVEDLLAAIRFLCQHSYHLSPDWGSITEHFPSYDELRITGVILMLRAMAVECLLKALWIKGGGQLSYDGKYRKIPDTNDHELLTLADKVLEKIDLNLSANERKFLKRLSRNIVSGRYPIHRDCKVQKKPQAGGNRRRSKLMVPDYDDDLFDSIYSKLKKHVADDLKEMFERDV